MKKSEQGPEIIIPKREITPQKKEELLNNIKEGKNFSRIDLFDIAPIDDIDAAKALSKLDPFYISHVSEDLKKDPKFVNFAIEQDGIAIASVDQSFQSDKETLLKAAKNSGGYYTFMQFVDEKLRNDREIVLEVLKRKNNCLELRYMNDELRDDEEIIFTAIQYGSAQNLEDASQRLRKDEQFIRRVIQSNPRAFIFADEGVQKNKDLAMEVSKKNIMGINPEYWVNDEEMRELLKKNYPDLQKLLEEGIITEDEYSEMNL